MKLRAWRGGGAGAAGAVMLAGAVLVSLGLLQLSGVRPHSRLEAATWKGKDPKAADELLGEADSNTAEAKLSRNFTDGENVPLLLIRSRLAIRGDG